MALRRKVFRIEEMYLAAARNGRAESATREDRDCDTELLRAVDRTKLEIAALRACGLAASDGGVRQELDAVVGGADESFQRILTAAEDIDEAANTLMALLGREQDQALARAIRDQVARIFEACSFHDLAGQRISKVLGTLQSVDDRVTRIMDVWGGSAAFGEPVAAPLAAGNERTPPVNGPKLDGAPGHATQQDIDTLFD
jgi:chemotaxis protein CheZ